MKNRLLITLAAGVTIAAFAFAQQATTKTETIKVGKTPANNGKLMYNNYCAPCHGTDGKGAGPVAGSLKQAPTDLTVLAKNNGGKYPEAHMVATLQFGTESKAASHGTASMPVWGPILGNMDQGSPQDKQLRISNLSRYIETLQAK
jgi:mono/diheme cytochrome c family protein